LIEARTCFILLQSAETACGQSKELIGLTFFFLLSAETAGGQSKELIGIAFLYFVAVGRDSWRPKQGTNRD
jgi:hypothetical protein